MMRPSGPAVASLQLTQTPRKHIAALARVGALLSDLDGKSSGKSVTERMTWLWDFKKEGIKRGSAD